ncbi:MAG TPA: serine/threonine-protein kinase, partial [candidate division Zixibacteria bacterium]|nr:serine/threonine-protein kinase [candidate division Zixibacteria bacterium]
MTLLISWGEMTLEAGTQLGPYRIDGPAGAGGMGEVYKATDTRLQRTVAVKVLHTRVASNPDLRERFEREAKVIAGLNHPNICTLHDIGSANEIDYLVMEYIEGESLSSRLEKGPLAAGEILTIAIQIADALDKAHKQGLVHRDLKPGNIMLTREGAKLLDFGLAKFQPQAGFVDDLSSGQTRTTPLTIQGAIIGTLQYMAPEQLEGQEADARSDIFAFGATLYEMATGKSAFEGKSRASLIASVLKEQPRPVSEITPLTPAPLESVISQCLAKEPDQRWQTAGDLKRSLELIRSGGALPGMAGARGARSGSAKLAWSVAAVAVLIAAALGAS